jgi:hypothetical protein
MKGLSCRKPALRKCDKKLIFRTGTGDTAMPITYAIATRVASAHHLV